MAQIVLIVGINGFVGKHLARELAAAGCIVHGTGLGRTIDPEIQTLVAHYTPCDLTIPEEVKTIPLETVDGIINLAALAVPSQSFHQEDLYYKVNVLAHTNLLARMKEINKRCRVLAVSTGAVYDSEQPMPLTETSILTTTGSPYVSSKQMLEERLEEYRQSGFEIIVARPFNHTGPGQGPGLIVPDLTERILHEKEIVVGPLNTSRDYTHVVDVVRAYRLLITRPGTLSFTVYNICSGSAVSRDELIALIEKTLHRAPLPRRIDPTIGRPNDPLKIYGDNHRIFQELGWKPQKNLEDIISDYVEWLQTQEPA